MEGLLEKDEEGSMYGEEAEDCGMVIQGINLPGEVGSLSSGLIEAAKDMRRRRWKKWLCLGVTGLFLSNENTIEPAIDLLALVLRESSRDR